MTRMLTIAAFLAILCPTTSSAAPGVFNKPALNMSLRPHVLRVCMERNVRCEKGSDCCSGSCYVPGGSKTGYCG